MRFPTTRLLLAALLLLATMALPAGAQTCSAANESAWRAKALSSNDPAACERYLACFQLEDGAASVRQRLQDLKNDLACRQALAATDANVLQDFIVRHGDLACARQVAGRLEQLRARRQYVPYPNMILAGSPLSRGAADSTDTCQLRCDATQRCTAYSFEITNRACTLWSTATTRMPNGKVNSGALAAVPLLTARVEKPRVQNDTQPTPNPPIFRRIDVGLEYSNDTDRGADYNTLDSISLPACVGACKRDPLCRMFSYYRGLTTCVLKSRAQGARPSRNVVSGIKR
ncbi:PAN domain-containing protein [Xanthobacter variabilis]|uniref:PAN domain-containing protein n=1 Tax=Xanthobacter variabilis TaxID=3119932 RepID=UPI00374FBA6F